MTNNYTHTHLLHIYSQQYNELMSQINSRYDEANRIRTIMCTLTNDIMEAYRNDSIDRVGTENFHNQFSSFVNRTFSEPVVETNAGINFLFNDNAFVTAGPLHR